MAWHGLRGCCSAPPCFWQLEQLQRERQAELEASEATLAALKDQVTAVLNRYLSKDSPAGDAGPRHRAGAPGSTGWQVRRPAAGRAPWIVTCCSGQQHLYQGGTTRHQQSAPD